MEKVCNNAVLLFFSIVYIDENSARFIFNKIFKKNVTNLSIARGSGAKNNDNDNNSGESS